MTEITFGSLFAGIGGFDLGFERAAMVCKWQVEIDDYANRVLAKHWPDVRRWDDVNTFPPPLSSPVIDWNVDAIVGGFPCQDISYAGRGAGLAGERSGLFFEAVRVVRQLRPRIVVLENVAALLTRGLDRVLGELGQIGYDAEWHCIPAASVGAPHIRDRVFVIAYAESMGRTARSGMQSDEGCEGKRWREPSRSDQALADTAGNGIGTQPDSHQATRQQSPRRRDATRCGVVCGIRPTADSGWWATEPNVGRVANGVPARVVRLRCLGNAVVPQVAEYIGRRIVEGMKQP